MTNRCTGMIHSPLATSRPLILRQRPCCYLPQTKPMYLSWAPPYPRILQVELLFREHSASLSIGTVYAFFAWPQAITSPPRREIGQYVPHTEQMFRLIVLAA